MLKEALPSHNRGLEGQDKKVTHKGVTEQKQSWKEVKNLPRKSTEDFSKIVKHLRYVGGVKPLK